MISPKLIRLDSYWELATWDDFTHIDGNGNERLNMLMPYLYADESENLFMGRLRTETNLEYLKSLIQREKVYRISKASTDESTPLPYYVRRESY
jgi:hypothetical protein